MAHFCKNSLLFFVSKKKFVPLHSIDILKPKYLCTWPLKAARHSPHRGDTGLRGKAGNGVGEH